MRFPWTALAIACFPLWLVKRAILRRTRAKADERKPWWSEVRPKLLVGGIPFPGDLDELRKRGVTAVVSLCAEYHDDEAAYRDAGILFLHAPSLDDFTVPVEKLERVSQWIGVREAEGRTVYVHCAAGRGRSVAVVLAHLVRTQALSTDDALALVCKNRPQAGPTPWQLRAVRAFEAKVRAPRRTLSGRVIPPDAPEPG